MLKMACQKLPNVPVLKTDRYLANHRYSAFIAYQGVVPCLDTVSKPSSSSLAQQPNAG
jgi:hypothetical protein